MDRSDFDLYKEKIEKVCEGYWTKYLSCSLQETLKEGFKKDD